VQLTKHATLAHKTPVPNCHAATSRRTAQIERRPRTAQRPIKNPKIEPQTRLNHQSRVVRVASNHQGKRCEKFHVVPPTKRRAGRRRRLPRSPPLCRQKSTSASKVDPRVGAHPPPARAPMKATRANNQEKPPSALRRAIAPSAPPDSKRGPSRPHAPRARHLRETSPTKSQAQTDARPQGDPSKL
jgi:hypothetical protein